MSPRKAPVRVALDPHEMVVLHHYVPEMAQAVARFPSDDWTALAAQIDVPLQPVRSPEEALDDPLFLDDGCVVEVADDGVAIRQVGQAYSLSACPTTVATGRARPGQHDDEVRAEAANAVDRAAGAAGGAGTDGPAIPTTLGSPLAGVLVLDLGLAAAGPFGAQLLADLGADVIKVHQFHDGYWMANHIGMGCNRGKRSIAVNLKSPEGKRILHELVGRADVVHHNMRYEAATRLGVDYESLREVNPRLIYCHTRGFERGPRDQLPGNDQTAAALAGVEWMDGGLDDDGMPIWAVTSLGDTGNGFLSAIAVVQALLHRDRTGEGQYVDTSIMYAHLLNTSMAWKSADGNEVGNRPRLDRMQLGWGPLYRLYRAGDDRWLCLYAAGPGHWQALCDAMGAPELANDPRFASADDRAANASELTALLEATFGTKGADEWFAELDRLGVPCEITSEDSASELFDDPDLRDKGWIATYHHPVVGRMEVAGLLVDLSETPGRLAGPPPLVGQHTREILSELGYDKATVDTLLSDGAVAEANP